MLGKLKFILDLLPFNGDKTKIGAVLAALSALNYIMPHLGLGALITALSVPVINWATVALIVVGIIHKWLKAKYER